MSFKELFNRVTEAESFTDLNLATYDSEGIVKSFREGSISEAEYNKLIKLVNIMLQYIEG